MKRILFFILSLLSLFQIEAQTPNDCANAIIVCGNGTFFSNASGIGSTQEINACGGNESNSLWLEINIVQSGTLGFNLIPNDPNVTVDYDFWVFGPNTTCGALGGPIRCCTTNPVQAGLTSNVTGMIGTTLVTQSGPGANGNGFVRWLTVTAGQSYYIAIDRPGGNGGFQIQWTGTATAGTGAFPNPPTANSILPYKTCSNTPNIGIFDLNTVRPTINANTVGNTITFHTTISNAVDNVSPLPNIYANTSNPQTIYVRVTDNLTGCFTTTSFDLVVNTVPVATVAVSSNTICPGDNVTITFTGTPNATIEYTINSGPTQTAVLNALGVFVLNQIPLVTTTYNLAVVKALDSGGNVICSANPNDTEIVTISTVPTPTLTTTTPSCVVDGTTTISNYNAANTYTFSPIGPTVGVGGLVNSATLGTSYTVTSGNGSCSSAPSVAFTNNAQLSIPAVPTLTTTVATCLADGTATISNYNATNAYAFSPVGPTVGVGGLINSATLGTSYTVTSGNGSCSSAPSIAFTNNAQLVTPAVPTLTTTVATCLADGTTTISNYNATNAYTFSPVGPTIGASGLINNAALGTSYTITSGNGSCTSLPSVAFTNNVQLVTPAVPTLTTTVATCLADGTATVSNYNATNTYVFSPVGPTVGVGGLINSATFGTSYTVTSGNGSCTSLPSAAFTNNAQLVTPAVPTLITTVASCLADGTATISNYNATNTYVFSPVGPTVGVGGLINSATFGTSYTVTSSNGSCTSLPSVAFTNNAQLVTPAVPTLTTTAATCVNAGTATITNYNATNTYVFSPVGPSIGAGGLINSAVFGTSYTVTSGNGSCTSASSVAFSVNDISNITPTFSIIAPICLGDVLLALPTTSTNGINGLWSPALNNTATTTYTFTPSVGQCATNITLTIIVNSFVTPTFATIATICSGDVLLALPTTSTNGINGLWTPALNNTATTTYTFTPSAGQCASTATLTIVVQNLLLTSPLPLQYCDPNNDGFGVFDLTQVINSVTGGAAYTVTFHETQIDALIDGTSIATPLNYSNINVNTQTIYIRVESNTTTCFEIVQLQLIVNPTPEATQPQDYHVCDDNFDGFAVFDLSVINSEVLGSISAATHLVTYHTSLPDAQAGVGAITNILNYTNTIITTQTLWIRVETTATGCYDIVTLQLVVDPLPQSTQPAYAPYSLCDTTAPLGFEQFDLQSQEATILLGQLGMSVTFYPSLAQAQAQIGAIPSGLYTNIAPFVQTLGVVITNTASGCYVISTMDIRVEPLPTPIPPLQPYAVCDNDQDGFSQFDLCTLTAAINVGGYIITYHETQPDAQSNNNALACIYNNILSFTQIIWVRAEDTITHCVSTMPIVLQVDASPIMPTPLPTLTLCDTDSNNQNGITSFDLSQQTAALLAAQTNAAINYSVTYYNSQIAAQSGVGNIVSTTTYQGFDSQVIWVRIEHNATGCFIVGSFTLEVNIPLLLTTPTPLSVCDNDANPNDLHTTFDLTVKDNQITTGLPGYTVMYYPTYANALAGVNLITNPTAYINVPPAVQTIGVAVTSADGCKSYITLDIRVLPVPTPNTNPTVLVAQCENALNSGVQTMDITVNSAYIINSDPNVTLHYYHSLADATSIPPQNEILTPTAALIGDPSLLNVTPRPLNLIQNVYVVVSSNLFVDFNAQNCYTVVQQPFIINPLPLVVAIGAQQLCEADPTGNDGFEIFDLTDYNADLLAGNVTLPASNYTVSFYTDAALTNQIATPTAYTNTTNPQTIYAQVTNTSTGCSNSNSFDIIVNPKPLLTPPLDFSSCDSELNDNDGFYLYPLDALVSGILNGQSPGNFTVSFYHTQADADATPPTNAIIDLANYQAQSETIWIRVENNTTGCYQIGSFDIIIEQYASPVIETVDGIDTICVNFITSEVERSLTLFASNETVYLADPQPSYDYQWFIDGVAIPGAVSPGYTIDTALPNNESAVYTVSMTTTGALGCSTTSQSFTVYQSGPAVVAAGTIGYTVTDAFTENQIITVSVEGWGEYQYSLDDGPRQDSPVFENVSLGSHLITVWDTQGGLDFSCDALVIELIQTIDYPHYFTPNGDGIHDTWNIVGLEGQPSTKIYIFDRFGKLIKQISSTGQGWDGTYNGQQLPSTDYWFTVDYNEQESQKQFRAHFSLKR